jgi:hypothetical protein
MDRIDFKLQVDLAVCDTLAVCGAGVTGALRRGGRCGCLGGCGVCESGVGGCYVITPHPLPLHSKKRRRGNKVVRGFMECGGRGHGA